MAAEIFTLFADYIAQPFPNTRIVDIVVIDPALVAGVVGRINIDALDLALVLRQKGFQSLQIVARMIMFSLRSALWVYCASKTR